MRVLIGNDFIMQLLEKMLEKTDRLRYVAGEYTPAFFEMKIATDEPIDVNNMSREQWSTFFHEYIHFLQDITTTYGLYHIYAIGEHILSCVHQIKQMPLGNFDTPIDFEEDNQDNVQLQMDLYRLTNGERDDRKQFLNTFNIKRIRNEKKSLRRNNTIDEVECVVMETDSGDLHFGAREIMESMAYLIQRTCFPETPEHYQFPYLSAWKVAAHYSKSFAKSNGKVVALCEMSLMASNPGKVFVQIMKSIQSKRIKFQTTTDVYRYFDALKLFDYQFQINCTIYEAYQNTARYAFNHLHEYYQGEERFQDIMDWLARVHDFVLDIRENKRLIFKEIMNGGDVSTNQTLREVINAVGGPLMKNNKGDYYQFSNTPNLSMIKAVNTIYRDVFRDGVNVCDMHVWCRRSPNNNATSDCYLRPWMRSSNAATMCPFSALWRKWGLDGHNPE